MSKLGNSNHNFDLILKNKKVFLSLLSALILPACSVDASLFNRQPLSSEREIQERKSPDFIHGEVVTTSGGYQFTGVFGEISEKTSSLNGNQWQIEGVFYE